MECSSVSGSRPHTLHLILALQVCLPLNSTPVRNRATSLMFRLLVHRYCGTIPLAFWYVGLIRSSAASLCSAMSVDLLFITLQKFGLDPISAAAACNPQSSQ